MVDERVQELNESANEIRAEYRELERDEDFPSEVAQLKNRGEDIREIDNQTERNLTGIDRALDVVDGRAQEIIESVYEGRARDLSVNASDRGLSVASEASNGSVIEAMERQEDESDEVNIPTEEAISTVRAVVLRIILSVLMSMHVCTTSKHSIQRINRVFRQSLECMTKPEYLGVNQAFESHIPFDKAYSLIGGFETVPVELSENIEDVLESDTYQKAAQQRLDTIDYEDIIDEVVYSVGGRGYSRYYIRHPFHRSIIRYKLGQCVDTELSVIHLIRHSIVDEYGSVVSLQSPTGIRSGGDINYLLTAGDDAYVYAESADAVLSAGNYDVLNVITVNSDCDVHAVDSEVKLRNLKEVVPK